MLKWLLLAVVLGLALWWWTRGQRASSERSRQSAEPPAAGASSRSSPEPMLSCAHCATLIPQGEALRGPQPEALPYCSEEHRRAGPGKGGTPAP